MDWIEVTAKSLDEAVELALDRLGVVVDELEYEVLDEPRSGLFGMGRVNARIRARVKPLSREKPVDKRRRRRGSEQRSGGSGGSGGSRGSGRTREATATKVLDWLRWDSASPACTRDTITQWTCSRGSRSPRSPR